MVQAECMGALGQSILRMRLLFTGGQQDICALVVVDVETIP